MSTFYIAPTASGDGSGSSWANAGAITSLGAFIQAAGPGGEVLLRADQGVYQAYHVTAMINAGGAEGAPVTIRGVDGSGVAMRAQFVGGRPDPWNGGSSGGPELFHLGAGADHLVFESMSFQNTGNGVFRLGDNISDITIQNMDADNMRRFIWNHPTDNVATVATVDGLTLKHLVLQGYSKAAIDLRFDSHDILIEDVVGDSQGQDGDEFAMGVHLDDTVHDVVLRRVSVSNSFDSKHDYWNGDGFVTEYGVHHVLFEDTYAGFNTDAGYDLKSSDTVLLRAVSEGNKRNFRLWSDSITLEDSSSLDPIKRGGVTAPTHIWLDNGATVTMTGGKIVDHDTRVTAFDLAEPGAGAKLTVTGTLIDVDGAVLKALAGSTLILDGVLHAPSASSLLGTAGDDQLKGDNTANLLDGGDGDDVLLGGAGADTMIGGAGVDAISYAASPGGVAVDLSTGVGTGGEASGDKVSGVENVAGSDAADKLTGDDQANHIFGDEGNDAIDGGAGPDILEGGPGVDTSSYGRSAAGVTVDLMSGLSQGGDAEGDVQTGFENLQGSTFGDSLGGSDAANVLTGRAGDDTLAGLGGDDQLQGDAGADLMTGGLGNDTYFVDNLGDQVVEQPGQGTDAVRTSLNSFSLTAVANIENLIFVGSGGFQGTGGPGPDGIAGGSGRDTLTGDLGADTLAGNDGDDRLLGGGGDDALRGGNEADSLYGGDGGDNLDGGGNNDRLYGEAGGDTLAGGSGNDALDGGEAADTLDGGAGTDTLNGATGDDELRGGSGGDTLNGGDGLDRANYSASSAGVSVNLPTGTGSGGDAAGDKLSQVEIVLATGFDDTLTGRAGAETLDGAAGADVLDGGPGADRLVGGAGNDTYVIDDSGDQIVESGGVDTVRTSLSSYTLGSAMENLYYSGSGGFNGVGNASDNTLGGGSGGDTLAAGNGSDGLGGGGGDDVLNGGGNNDRLYGEAGADSLMGDGPVLGSGRGGADALDGGEGADVLYGDAPTLQQTGVGGADTLKGGAGDDTLYGDGASLLDTSRGGADDIYGGDGNDKIYGDGASVAASASGAADNLRGEGGDDEIYGGGADDKLNGADGADTLVGGTGADQLIGGAGDDRFLYAAGDGHDVISDFAAGGAEDVIRISGYSAWTELRQVGSDTLVVLSATDDILLKGVSPAALTSNDILFV